jgi:hypothetical protein
MTVPLSNPVVSNADFYRQMAEEALAAAQVSLAAHRRPKDDGAEGYIFSYDPTRTSFRQSLVAIVFAGIAIEAFLWLYGSEALGRRQYKSLEKKLTLEAVLPRLGLGDPEMYTKAKLFREARNELVHERAVPLSESLEPLRRAQEEAERAVALMNEILIQLQRKQGLEKPVA